MTRSMILRSVLALALAGGIAMPAVAADTLKVGDDAPGLDIEKWAKGNKTALETGSVYVVEFWATWCVPCRKSIPHLSELQKRYSEDGLTIIGVSDEEVATVEKFVRAQGSKMDYTVAVDRHNATKRAWFEKAGLKGIPAAFIVDTKGKIAFIGHPLSEEFETTLGRVLDGRYDPKLEAQAKPVLQAARSARQVRNWRMSQKYFDDVIALDPGVFAPVALEKFEMLLNDMDDEKAAYNYAEKELIGKLFASDAQALQMLAAKIAIDPKIDRSKRDFDVALEAVEASRRLSGQRDAKSLAALALIRFHRGEVQEAINLQKQAYFNAQPRDKRDFRRTLTNYQEAAQRTEASIGKSS